MNRKKLKIIPEELSNISFTPGDSGKYVLHDRLRKGSYILNETAYNICMKIDGEKRLQDIAYEIADKYNVSSLNEIEKDIIDLYHFLKKNKLVIPKNSLGYKLIKLYYFLLGINSGGD